MPRTFFIASPSFDDPFEGVDEEHRPDHSVAEDFDGRYVLDGLPVDRKESPEGVSRGCVEDAFVHGWMIKINYIRCGNSLFIVLIISPKVSLIFPLLKRI